LASGRRSLLKPLTLGGFGASVQRFIEKRFDRFERNLPERIGLP